MKKLFLIVAAIFVAVSFSACSDDDDNGHASDKPVLVKQYIVTEVGEYTETYNIEYDSQNRISRLYTKRSSSEKEYSFSYEGNMLTETDTETDYDYNDNGDPYIYTTITKCELNKDGYIEKAIDTYYDNGDYTLFSYKDGYLQSIQSKNSSPKCVYNWNNGNLASYENGAEVTTITYSQVVATPTNLDLNFVDEYYGSYNFWGFLGKKSKNLPEKLVIKSKESANTLTITYQYELNSNKTISKVLVSEVQTGDYNESRNYSIKFVY